MVFELWFEEGGCTAWFAKPAEALAVWLISEGRHSDAVADKIIFKIVSENRWRSLCCHSYSCGLQKHLNNSNKHDIKTGLLGL